MGPDSVGQPLRRLSCRSLDYAWPMRYEAYATRGLCATRTMGPDSLRVQAAFASASLMAHRPSGPSTEASSAIRRQGCSPPPSLSPPACGHRRTHASTHTHGRASGEFQARPLTPHHIRRSTAISTAGASGLLRHPRCSGVAVPGGVLLPGRVRGTGAVPDQHPEPLRCQRADGLRGELERARMRACVQYAVYVPACVLERWYQEPLFHIRAPRHSCAHVLPAVSAGLLRAGGAGGVAMHGGGVLPRRGSLSRRRPARRADSLPRQHWLDSRRRLYRRLSGLLPSPLPFFLFDYLAPIHSPCLPPSLHRHTIWPPFMPILRQHSPAGLSDRLTLMPLSCCPLGPHS